MSQNAGFETLTPNAVKTQTTRRLGANDAEEKEEANLDEDPTDEVAIKVVTRILNSLKPQERADLRAKLDAIGTFRTASLCSGSGQDFLALQVLVDLVKTDCVVEAAWALWNRCVAHAPLFSEFQASSGVSSTARAECCGCEGAGSAEPSANLHPFACFTNRQTFNDETT